MSDQLPTLTPNPEGGATPTGVSENSAGMSAANSVADIAAAAAAMLPQVEESIGDKSLGQLLDPEGRVTEKVQANSLIADPAVIEMRNKYRAQQEEAAQAPVQQEPEAPQATEPAPPSPEMTALAEENALLRKRLGIQGGERGGFVDKMDDMQAQLEAYQKEYGPLDPEQVDVRPFAEMKGIDVIRTLDPTLTERELTGEYGQFYERMGRMFKEQAVQLGSAFAKHLQQVSDRVGTFETQAVTKQAEAEFGRGLTPEIRQQVMDAYPEVSQVTDPRGHLRMVKSLALGMGLLESTPQEGTAPVRNPATHMTASGGSPGAYADPEQSARQDIAGQIADISKMSDPAEIDAEMKRVGKLVDADFQGGFGI